ncbi:MAG TPA: hypothetical protein VMZ92_00440 [Planctomycetota bacterium]|nr:hypothetical protein [Planctomycetota bacterium]
MVRRKSLIFMLLVLTVLVSGCQPTTAYGRLDTQPADQAYGTEDASRLCDGANAADEWTHEDIDADL